VQRETAQSKTGIFCNYGVAEAPPGFQAAPADAVPDAAFIADQHSCQLS
jgi:hypothetical protein